MLPVHATSEGGPDLLVPPHLLGLLMDMLTGEPQEALLQQEHVFTHLAECIYCRTSVVLLLSITQECERKINDPEEAVRLASDFS